MKKISNHPISMGTMTMFMVSLTLLFALAGCDKVLYEIVPKDGTLESTDGPDLSANVQTFRIGPQASVISAFDGLVSIEIPADAVDRYVNLAITKGYPVSIDSLILFPVSFKVSSENAELLKPIVVVMNYDPLSLDCKSPYDESCLKIYSWIDENGEDLFTETGSLKLVCGNNCCVDCTSKNIRACFDTFGTFIAGMGR